MKPGKQTKRSKDMSQYMEVNENDLFMMKERLGLSLNKSVQPFRL